MEEHDLALVGNDGEPYLLVGLMQERLAALLFEPHQRYLIAGTGQRGADTNHALVVIEVIGNRENDSFGGH